MTGPGPGGPSQPSPQHQGPPAHGQWQQQRQPPGQYAQGQYPPGQYPPAGGQWGPPPKRSGVGKVTLLVVLVVVLLGGGVAAVALLIDENESSSGSPEVDTSDDIDKAPVGCSLFTEAEIAPYIPGTMKMEPTGVGVSNEMEESGGCRYGNNDSSIQEDVPAAFIDITTYVYQAAGDESGVDRAKEELRREQGGPLGLPEVDEDVYQEQQDSNNKVDGAKLTIRYKNIVVSIYYSHRDIGPKGFTPAMQELGTAALRKVAPPEQSDGGGW